MDKAIEELTVDELTLAIALKLGWRAEPYNNDRFKELCWCWKSPNGDASLHQYKTKEEAEAGIVANTQYAKDHVAAILLAKGIAAKKQNFVTIEYNPYGRVWRVKFECTDTWQESSGFVVALARACLQALEIMSN